MTEAWYNQKLLESADFLQKLLENSKGELARNLDIWVRYHDAVTTAITFLQKGDGSVCVPSTLAFTHNKNSLQLFQPGVSPKLDHLIRLAQSVATSNNQSIKTEKFSKERKQDRLIFTKNPKSHADPYKANTHLSISELRKVLDKANTAWIYLLTTDPNCTSQEALSGHVFGLYQSPTLCKSEDEFIVFDTYSDEQWSQAHQKLSILAKLSIPEIHHRILRRHKTAPNLNTKNQFLFYSINIITFHNN